MFESSRLLVAYATSVTVRSFCQSRSCFCIQTCLNGVIPVPPADNTSDAVWLNCSNLTLWVLWTIDKSVQGQADFMPRLLIFIYSLWAETSVKQLGKEKYLFLFVSKHQCNAVIYIHHPHFLNSTRLEKDEVMFSLTRLNERVPSAAQISVLKEVEPDVIFCCYCSVVV